MLLFSPTLDEDSIFGNQRPVFRKMIVRVASRHKKHNGPQSALEISVDPYETVSEIVHRSFPRPFRIHQIVLLLIAEKKNLVIFLSKRKAEPQRPG